MHMGSTFVSVAMALLMITGCGDRPTENQDSEVAEIQFSGDVASDLTKVDEAIKAGPFSADWDSLAGNGVADWYRDAKLGIFVHWGAYSVPAYGNEWYPRRMYLSGDGSHGNSIFQHHRDTWGAQKEFGYKDFIPMFTAENFDADAWAELFEESGAKYVVPVAEHHDGFSLYANSYTKWDSTEMGPKRDIVSELGEAIRARGLKLGVSSHRAFNFGYYVRDESFDTVDEENFGLYGEPRDDLYYSSGRDQGWFPQSDTFMDNWLVRTAEMVEKSQADLLWFDFGIGPESVEDADENPLEEYLQRFTAFYYNRAKARGKTAVVNYKLNAMPRNVAVLDLERARLSGMSERFYQTDTSVSFSSWGYVTNHRYKPVGLIVANFVDVVSKNGCLLLNIGPKADGTIPEEEAAMLRDLGGWLRINGEAIYGSRPWKIYGEGPTQTVEGHLSEERNQPLGAQDIRYTTQGETVYATALGLAEEEWRITTLGANSEHLEGAAISGVTLLGYDGDLEWRQDNDALVIQSPGEDAGQYAYVFKLTIE